MTVVVRVVRENTPLLFGDLLLSGPAVDPIVLPVTDFKPVIDRRTNYPSGLRQKIAIIGQNVIAGWAGRLSVACDVLSELMLRSEVDTLDLRTIDECIANQRPSTWQDVSILGLVREDDGTKPFGRAYYSVKSPISGLESASLIGSGYQMVADVMAHDSLASVERVGDSTPLDRSILYALRTMGSLLQGEMYVQNSLAKSFGGGYELATFIEGKPKKLSSITYVFWEVQFGGPQATDLKLNPLRVVQHAYRGDLLVIRSIEFSPENGRLVADRLFQVPPAYRYLSNDEKANCDTLNMSGNFVCSFFLVNSSQGIRVLQFAGHRQNPDSWIRFVDREEGLVCEIDDSFLKAIVSEISNRLRNEPS